MDGIGRGAPVGHYPSTPPLLDPVISGVKPSARRHRLFLVGDLIGEPVARLEAAIEDAQGPMAMRPTRLNAPAWLTIHSAIQAQNWRSPVTPGSATLSVATKRASLRMRSTPKAGTSERTVTRAMAVARTWPRRSRE